MMAAERPSLLLLRAKSAQFWEIRGYHTHVSRTGALFAMQDTRWDHALKVTGGGTGLVGHAGAVLLGKAADRAGLTGGLSAALRKAGTSPLLDQGIVLASMAAAIALGATSMSDIAVLAHLAPVLGDAPSGPTIRRALGLAGTSAMLNRIARARARAHVWTLIEQAPAGFPWLAIAGKTLTGWLVIDMDATLVTARSDKERAAPTWEKGYGFFSELKRSSIFAVHGSSSGGMKDRGDQLCDVVVVEAGEGLSVGAQPGREHAG
jgi:hypothetical protein